MKRKFSKILGVGLAMVLVCSFSLVTAVPVAADSGDVEFTTEGNGTWEWSTGAFHSGSYSVLLAATNPDSASVGVEVNPTLLTNITQLSFWYNHEECNPASGHVLGPDLVLVLAGSEVGPFYIAGTGGALDSVGSWLEADAIEGTNFSGTSTWWYGSCDADLSNYTTLGDDLTFSALQAVPALSGTAVLYAAVNLDPPGEGSSGSVYVDVITVNNTPYDLEQPAAVWVATGGFDTNPGTETAPFLTIQHAIDILADGTVNVATGDYAGAEVNKGVKIIGAAGGTSIITSGPHYGGSHGTPHTAFLLGDGADGAEIRNFTINCDTANFWFGVFARSADSVIVDSLTINDTVQGITSWGGSNWEITNNVITETYPTTGGGIAIHLGADPTNFPNCDNNLVQGNTVTTNHAGGSTFTGAAIALFFDMRDYKDTDLPLPAGESMTGNEITGNSITASGLENQVGIEIGVGGLANPDKTDNTTKVAACLGIIHDNTVQNNTIDNAEWGLYLYVTTNLTVQGNTIGNCSECGIYMKDDHVNCLINYNDIYGNINYGLNNTDGATYDTTVDATNNWWGDPSGPYHTTNPNGEGNVVSDNVDFDPWSTQPDFTGSASQVGFTAEVSDVIAISVTPTITIDFGSVIPGVDAVGDTITVGNAGNVAIDLDTSLSGVHPLFYTDYLYLNTPKVLAWTDTVSVDGWTTAIPKLSGIPANFVPGSYTATLIFWAEKHVVD